jgi:hypothetical protein
MVAGHDHKWLLKVEYVVTVTVVQTSPWFFFLFVESSLNSRHVDLNCKYERGCQYL